MNPTANLAEAWRKLTSSQKTVLSVAALIVIAVIIAAISMASAPQYVQLYGNLTAEDASAVITRLKEQKIPYRINGSDIEVPVKNADELRMALAGEGIPQGGNVGFELFDKTQIGQSEFGEHVNYRRALSGELQRTICRLDSVRSARVHLVLPERSLYASEEERPSASVVLDLNGTEPSAKEIKAVMHLVASAVEGLDMSDITVMDTEWNLLSDMPNLNDDGGDPQLQLRVQRDIQQQIQTRVQAILDRVLGPDKAIVSASVKLGLDRKQVDRETYTPVQTGSGQGVLESQHRTLETYDGDRPGSRIFSPGAQANAALGGAGGTTVGGGASKYSHEENTAQYRVSKEVQHIEQKPGQVERISLALFVDEGVDNTQLSQLQQSVAAAAGLDPERDPEVKVTQIAFDTSAKKAADKKAQAEAKSEQLAMYIKYGAGGLLILLFLGFLFMVYRSTLAPVTAKILPTPEEPLPAAPYQMLPSPERALEEYAALSPSAPAAAAIAESEAEGLPQVDEPTPEEAMALNTLDPQRIAKVIKGMLAEE